MKKTKIGRPPLPPELRTAQIGLVFPRWFIVALKDLKREHKKTVAALLREATCEKYGWKAPEVRK